MSSLEKFLTNIPNFNELDELIFFGGSFNPWHEGHSSCIHLMDPNKTIIIIPDHNPFKKVIPSKDKLNTTHDLTKKLQEFKNPTYLYTGFLEKDKKNPTSYWISKLRAGFPQKKLSLLVGFDTFMGIDKWIESSSLLNNLDTLYVDSRMDDEKLKKQQLELLKSMASIHIHFLGRHEHEQLSSTQIREEK